MGTGGMQPGLLVQGARDRLTSKLAKLLRAASRLDILHLDMAAM